MREKVWSNKSYFEMTLLRSFSLLLFFFGLNRGQNFQVIELDHELEPQTPHFPSVTVGFQQKVIEAGYRYGFWFANNRISSTEQMGTQVNAPYSYDPNGLKINEIPVENFFATVAVIDVKKKASNNSSYVVSVDDVTEWIDRNGMFPKKCVVLFNTAWDEGRYPDQIAYFGSDKSIYELKYPGVSLNALETILGYEKSDGINFVGFGIDTPLLDPGTSTNYFAARRVSLLGKYAVNNLRNLRKLPSKGAKIMIMPMKIRNGTGAPARVVARLPYKAPKQERRCQWRGNE